MWAFRFTVRHDFGKDIIPRWISKARLGAYQFRDNSGNFPGYWRDIGTIDAYFDAHDFTAKTLLEFWATGTGQFSATALFATGILCSITIMCTESLRPG